MLKYFLGFLVLAFLIVLVFAVINSVRNKDNCPELTPADFERQKKLLHLNCSREEYLDFFRFIKKYPGGYYRRRNGKVVWRDYTGKEKGDLKGIFFNIVFPSSNLTSEEKEEFRMYIVSKGVSGLNYRPDYETRDGKLTNRNTDEDEFERKEVGNKGEEVVRNKLNRLKSMGFLVINGPVLEIDNKRVEYDHIVIGNNGVFALETKAFGTSKEGGDRASLFIDKGDKWILRKNGNNRELKSPTEQVCREREHLKQILYSAKEKIDVTSVLVLSNSELFLKNNIKLDYDVVSVNNLEEYIINTRTERIVEDEKMLIAEIIDDHRVN